MRWWADVKPTLPEGYRKPVWNRGVPSYVRRGVPLMALVWALAIALVLVFATKQPSVVVLLTLVAVIVVGVCYRRDPDCVRIWVQNGGDAVNEVVIAAREKRAWRLEAIEE